MAIPVINSRDLPNTWRILDDKLGNFRDRGLPFKYPYVGAFAQSVAEWFLRVYSNPGDTVFEPFCVCKNSVVLLNQQDKILIQNIEKRKKAQIDLFENSDYIDNVMSMNIENKNEDMVITSDIKKFHIRSANGADIYNIHTRNKRSLNASGNHVFLVKNIDRLEWKRLKEIRFGDLVAIYPSIICLNTNTDKEEIILDDNDILANIPENTNREKILSELKNAKLLPLKNNHPKLNIIARLCGFLLTDGYIGEYKGEKYFYDRERKGNISRFDSLYTHIGFTSGRSHSLIDIYNDIKLLGLDIGNYLIDTRFKESSIKDWRPLKCADMDLCSKTAYVFFKSLGIPQGKKTNQMFRLPKWIFRCSMKVKQEFLGGLAGGDGTSVDYREKKLSGRVIQDIVGAGFTQSKILELKDSLLLYLSDVCKLLDDFGLKYRVIPAGKYIRNEDEKEVVTYRIDLLDNHDNTLKFLKYIGYRYDNHKIGRSYPIYEYLLSKQNRIGINKGVSRGNSFPLYEKWKDIYTLNNLVFDEVIAVKKIDYDDKLYDLSVGNTHNYIVNEFVTHNSGRGTTAMQALYTGRNMICNDLSPYSNILCHSIMFPPYMKDVLNYLKIIEDYMRGENCNIPTNYAGKDSDDDVAKLYHERTFSDIIKLRNLLNSRSMLLGRGYDNLPPLKWLNIEDNIQKQREYAHEIIMFLRMVMSQLMLHSSSEMSFNGIKTRGTDNTYIKGLLRYYESIKETPKHINIFDNMKYFIEKMKLDELGVRDKFIKLNRKLISCDARKIDLPDKCADAVVTSPPYYANLNYGMANWLRIWAIGGIGDILIGNHINTEKLEKFNNSEIYGKTYDRITDKAGGTVDNPMSYSNFTGWYLKELYRILKDDAVAIIIVGDYGNKRKIEAWRVVSDRAEIFGFKPQMIIMDELNKQTKSSTQFQMKHEGGKNDYDVCVVLFKGKYETKNNPEDIDFRWGAKFADGKQLGIDAAWG